MRWRAAVVAALTVGASAADARAQRGSSRPEPLRLTPAQIRAFGRKALQQEVAQFGRLGDAAMSARVGTILKRLTLATDHPALSVEWEIVRDASVNASMLPGAAMVINAGLLTQIGEWARAEVPGDVTLRERRFDAYLAAVLGHELAHATLGHSDSALVAAVRAESQSRLRTAGAEDMETKVRTLLNDTTFMSTRRVGRGHELDADRVGSLYLLRAGWEIQDAMSLMRLLDAMERSAGGTSLASLGWFADHPRSSMREASLESFRASLKVHQGEFDDALLLLRNNIMLDSAAALLDRVLTDFPDLVAALHARATVLHRQWLNAVPVQQLLVRSSVPTYDARFITGIRGGQANPLLAAARKAYGQVLARELQPFTLSNLAVLDAYAGMTSLALARSDSAVRMMPDDPYVQNNRAAVLFLAQRLGDARDIYRTLLRANPAWSSARFNYGRSQLALGDTAGARGTFRDYLIGDGESAWAREASRVLQVLDASASVAPKATSGSLPVVAGVALGARSSQVRALLGVPESTRRGDDVTIWRYMSRGFVVGIGRDSLVTIVGLSHGSADNVDGVRVGDTDAKVRARWGTPVEYTERMLVFDRGAWIATAFLDDGLVVELGAERRK